MAQCDKLRGHEFFSHDLYFDEECYSKKKKKKKKCRPYITWKHRKSSDTDLGYICDLEYQKNLKK